MFSLTSKVQRLLLSVSAQGKGRKEEGLITTIKKSLKNNAGIQKNVYTSHK